MSKVERKVNDDATIEVENVEVLDTDVINDEATVVEENVFALIPEFIDKGYNVDDVVDIELLQNEYLRAEENYDKYLRAVAESQNIRKRVTEDRNNALKYKNESVLRDMLPVMDNFDRAFKTYEDAHDTLTDKGREILDGMSLIYKSFKDALNNAGLKDIEINPGDEFTTDTMNAIMNIDNPKFEVNQVIDVVNKGYIYNDKVLRYASVVVCNRN